jgi:hypothetical protein
MQHVVRVACPWLRIPLLAVLFPVAFASYVGRAALPVAWGGHPDKRRLLCRDFYSMPVALFWAAFDGAFVPK